MAKCGHFIVFGSSQPHRVDSNERTPPSARLNLFWLERLAFARNPAVFIGRYNRDTLIVSKTRCEMPLQASAHRRWKIPRDEWFFCEIWLFLNHGIANWRRGFLSAAYCRAQRFIRACELL